MYLDLNILQSVPSSNINRDDTGAPKTAIYGGVLRSRVSSQSWKHAIRQDFIKDRQKANWLAGYRSKEIPDMVAKEIINQDSNISLDDAHKKTDQLFKLILGAKNIGDDHKTSSLLMLSHGEIVKLAKYIIDTDEKDFAKSKKEIKSILKSDNSLDLALFGRMVAADPSLNVEAASQVAHAVSTHEITQEFDYYSAIGDTQDDKEKDSQGSDMLGTIDYNSSTLYRYANVNIDELKRELGDDTVAKEGLKLFIKEFILSMPTGYQNSFGNKTLPNYIMLTLRDDTPVNLVSAFETPVTNEDGYIKPSIKKLEEQYQVTQKLVDKPIKTLILTTETSDLPNQADNINDLIDQITKDL